MSDNHMWKLERIQQADSIFHVIAQTNLKYATVGWDRIGCDDTFH